MLILTAIAQMCLGIFIYSSIIAPPTVIDGHHEYQLRFDEVKGFWPALIILFILSMIVCISRRQDDESAIETFLYVLLDFLLSPLALFRLLIALMLTKVGNCDYTYKVDGYDFKDKSISFLFYTSELDLGDVSPFQNFILQLLLAFPMSLVLTACAFLAYYTVKSGFGLFGLIVSVGALAMVAPLFTHLKTTEISVSWSARRTVFRNKYHGGYINADGWNYAARQRNGWYKVCEFISDETSSHTPHYIFYCVLSFLFSPILAFTQAIGVVFAFLAMFIPFIKSKMGQIDYTSVRLPFLQFIFGFFFSFVFTLREQ
jgi:hypothetical protein